MKKKTRHHRSQEHDSKKEHREIALDTSEDKVRTFGFKNIEVTDPCDKSSVKHDS